MNQVELLSGASDGLDAKETGRGQGPGHGVGVFEGDLGDMGLCSSHGC